MCKDRHEWGASTEDCPDCIFKDCYENGGDRIKLTGRDALRKAMRLLKADAATVTALCDVYRETESYWHAIRAARNTQSAPPGRCTPSRGEPMTTQWSDDDSRAMQQDAELRAQIRASIASLNTDVGSDKAWQEWTVQGYTGLNISPVDALQQVEDDNRHEAEDEARELRIMDTWVWIATAIVLALVVVVLIHWRIGH